MRRLFTFGIGLLSLLTASHTLAQAMGGGGGGRSSGWYLSIAAKGGLGDAGTADGKSIETRDMYTFGGELMFGKTLGPFLLGASGEYNLFKQKTKASEVNNTNMAGTQLNVSPVLGIGLGSFLFVLKPVVYSDLKNDKRSESGVETSLNSPKLASFGFQINYRLSPNTFFGLEYSKVQYTKVDLGEGEATLKGDFIVNYSSMGIIYGYKF